MEEMTDVSDAAVMSGSPAQPQRALLYGGSFNPPTLAHEAIMRACLALPDFDEVWVMPSGSRDDKIIPTSEQYRLQMLLKVHQYRFNNDPRLRITDFELNLPRPTRTDRTLKALHAAYPQTEFWFVCGPDSYQDMPNWPGAAEFMLDLCVVVFGEQPLPAEGPRLRHLPLPPEVHDVSSTAARAALGRGEDISRLVSQPVADYIATHGLYC